MDDNNIVTMKEILEAINELRKDSVHINEALSKLEPLKSEGSGDIGAQAKANAIAEVVKCRETTIQRMLQFYEMLYEDMRPKKRTKDLAINIAEQALNSEADVDLEQLSNLFDSIRHI
jgi:hypothetical protein